MQSFHGAPFTDAPRHPHADANTTQRMMLCTTLPPPALYAGWWRLLGSHADLSNRYLSQLENRSLNDHFYASNFFIKVNKNAFSFREILKMLFVCLGSLQLSRFSISRDWFPHCRIFLDEHTTSIPTALSSQGISRVRVHLEAKIGAMPTSAQGPRGLPNQAQARG